MYIGQNKKREHKIILQHVNFTKGGGQGTCIHIFECITVTVLQYHHFQTLELRCTIVILNIFIVMQWY